MTQAVKKNGVTFGIIIGVISIIISAIMYATDLSLFTKWWVGIVLFFINLILGIVAVGKAKASQGGFISFKETFTTFFIAMAIGAAISSTFMFILFNFIDPGAKDIILENVKEMTVNMMQEIGSSTEDIKKTVEKLDETDNFSFASQLQSYMWGLLLYIIIGLIVAAIMKKNKPEFE
ncbi:hypothetical protein CHU92_06875 [Flavobacterium cyanobacteriorum]|uniref:DUF4199 domain-containing protein n=1 Tax=Flavobacterium cyanobacteriorum TaxID=2022802 RepID=A0A255ZBN9_9FLAO|nr:DUF4199 domain-containing protein [Flavobacterium cyanobacteriorum]OYQ38020.1 hypothetical protein CHU92_06875 [Flavobacterium cyanobacteriorum]